MPKGMCMEVLENPWDVAVFSRKEESPKLGFSAQNMLGHLNFSETMTIFHQYNTEMFC